MKPALHFIVPMLYGLFLIGCSKYDDPHNYTPQIEHVVFIGIDGWDSSSFGDANIPTIKHLKENGFWTLKKRSVFPSSSGPNWTSIFTGLGVEQHGYTEWGSITPEIPSVYTDENGNVPTFFTILKKENIKNEIGFVCEWGTLKNYIDSTSVDYFQCFDQSNPDAIFNGAVDYIIEKSPKLFAIIIDQLDHTGHQYGWDSMEYISKLEEIDSRLSHIVEASNQAFKNENTVFVLLSDHGGIGKEHGGKTINEVETPFIIYGPGIKREECKLPIMQYDVASYMVSLFGLQQPYYWIGRINNFWKETYD